MVFEFGPVGIKKQYKEQSVKFVDSFGHDFAYMVCKAALYSI